MGSNTGPDKPQRVTFKSLGLTLFGNLYTPPHSTESRNRAAIVVSHPFTAVKEQTAGLHAETLANRGFVTLAFDAAYGGESEGSPHGLENPMQRAEDIRSAVTYLQTLSDLVDPQRIGVLGICASGGYAPFAAQTDPRMKAVATVSAMCTGRAIREGLPPYEPVTETQMQDLLAGASGLRMQEYTGEDVSMAPLFPKDASVREKMSNVTKEGWDYYNSPRGQHSRSPNEFAIVSATLLGNYYSYDRNWMISPRPLLMIVGETADSKYISEDAIALAREPKELFIVKGASHLDLYDHLDGHVEKLVLFFSKYLCK